MRRQEAWEGEDASEGGFQRENGGPTPQVKVKLEMGDEIKA